MQNTPDRTVLITISEAARRLSVSERLLWKAISQGTLEAVKIGRATRILASDIDRIAREGLRTGGR
ncbi:MAG: helix-turn-helix domain-containing protein [Phycisphaerales bacterium JB054]